MCRSHRAAKTHQVMMGYKILPSCPTTPGINHPEKWTQEPRSVQQSFQTHQPHPKPHTHYLIPLLHVPRTDLVSSPCSMSSESKFNILLICFWPFKNVISRPLPVSTFSTFLTVVCFRTVHNSALWTEQCLVSDFFFFFTECHSWFHVYFIVNWMYKARVMTGGLWGMGAPELFFRWKYERLTFLLFPVTQEPQLRKY